MLLNSQLHRLLLRYEEESAAGNKPDVKALCHDCPELVDSLTRRIAVLEEMQWLESQNKARDSVAASSPTVGTSLLAGMEPISGYQLIRPLGQGGFGQVWQAQGPGGLQVALKFVPLGGRQEEFENRAFTTIKDIRHPHLLSVLGIWTTGTHLVIGMELADETLTDRFKFHRVQGLPGIPLEEAHRYLREAAAGLDALVNQAHLQHRDVKPSNLLLVGGCVKVGDFGLTRLMRHTMTEHTGNLTLAYAAPEFFDGKTSIYSDQYSLAISYVELITGTLPFSGSPAKIVAGHLFLSPDLSNVPESERGALIKALSKNPDERWPSCSAFYQALMEGSATQPVSVSRRRYLKWAVGAAGIAVAAGAWWWKSRPNWEVVRDYEWPDVMQTSNHFRCLVADDYADWLLGNADYSVNPRNVHKGHPVLWDLKTGRIRKVLDVQGGPAIAIVPYAQESQWFATGSDDGELILWNTNSAEKVPTRFAGHPPPSSISSLAFSDNGKLLLTSATDNSVCLWNRLTGQEVKRFEKHDNFVMNAVFAQSDQQIVSSSWDSTVRLWDVGTGQCKNVLEGHKGQVWSLIVTSDNLAISGSKDGWVILWDLADGRELRRLNVGYWVQRLALSINKRWLLITGESHGRLMDLQTEKVLWEDESPLFAFGVCWHPKEADQVFVSGPGKVQLIQLRM